MDALTVEELDSDRWTPCIRLLILPVATAAMIASLVTGPKIQLIALRHTTSLKLIRGSIAKRDDGPACREMQMKL